MNLRHLVLALIFCWSSSLAEQPVPTLWAGKCVNRTAGASGQVKLILFESGAPDPTGARKVSGYMSVTGWLNGGGEFEGTIAKGDLTFKTTHVAPIEWKGSFGLDSLVGTYSVPAIGGQPEQTGAFEVDKVSRPPGPEAEVRQGMMVVIESQYNDFATDEAGKLQSWPQVIFDAIHPVGTGISIQVADLTLEWQEGADRTKAEGIRRYTTDLFLFWSSPLQPKGVTQLRTVHNAEFGELISCDVVRTNGTTTEEVKETAKDVGIKVGVAVGAALLKSWLESE